jgi:tetratricopeptide (TPR) repeat protein
MLRIHPTAAGLSRRRTATITEFAEVAVRHSWPDKAVSHLHALAERDPLNEHAGAWLMLALAGCGQQAEALAVYEAMRRRLDDQLGVEPSAELVAAHQQILRQHVPAAGLTRVAVATRPSPAEPARLALTLPGCQLPPAIADFTGRCDEAAALTAALTRESGGGPVPVVAISGLPGVGKTSLALQIAHQARDSFPDGQLWITLDGASSRPRDPGEVLGELLRMLGVHGAALPDSVSGRAALYRSRLAGQQVLVVADDAASARQVEPLLPGTGGAAVIITSRSPLAAPPGARLLSLQPLTPTEASDLLSRIAGPARVAAERDAAADLAGACGMLPLAVRIAGARLAARPSWPISVYHHLGRYHEAIETLSRVVSISERSHMRRYQALCLLKLGYTHQAMGDYEAAVRYIEKSLPIFAELRLPHYVERAREALESCRNGKFSDFTKPPAAVVSHSKKRATGSVRGCSTALRMRSHHPG